MLLPVHLRSHRAAIASARRRARNVWHRQRPEEAARTAPSEPMGVMGALWVRGRRQLVLCH